MRCVQIDMVYMECLLLQQFRKLGIDYSELASVELRSKGILYAAQFELFSSAGGKITVSFTRNLFFLLFFICSIISIEQVCLSVILDGCKNRLKLRYECTSNPTQFNEIGVTTNTDRKARDIQDKQVTGLTRAVHLKNIFCHVKILPAPTNLLARKNYPRNCVFGLLFDYIKFI